MFLYIFSTHNTCERFDPYHDNQDKASKLRMDPLLVPWEKPLQHVSTLVRQFLIDFIIITGLSLSKIHLVVEV